MCAGAHGGIVAPAAGFNASMRRSTCVPKYGAGLGRSTVACISCNSSVGAGAERLSLTASFVDNMVASFSWVRAERIPARTPDDDWPALLRDLVEDFIDGLADLFEPSGLRRSQVRAVDVPSVGRDLVAGDPVRRCLRVTH